MSRKYRRLRATAGEVGIYPPKWPKTFTFAGMKFSRMDADIRTYSMGKFDKDGRVYINYPLSIVLYVEV